MKGPGCLVIAGPTCCQARDVSAAILMGEVKPERAAPSLLLQTPGRNGK